MQDSSGHLVDFVKGTILIGGSLWIVIRKTDDFLSGVDPIGFYVLCLIVCLLLFWLGFGWIKHSLKGWKIANGFAKSEDIDE